MPLRHQSETFVINRQQQLFCITHGTFITAVQYEKSVLDMPADRFDITPLLGPLMDDPQASPKVMFLIWRVWVCKFVLTGNSSFYMIFGNSSFYMILCLKIFCYYLRGIILQLSNWTGNNLFLGLPHLTF